MDHPHDPAPTAQVTRLLHQLRGGDGKAMDEVFPLVYDELRRIAARQLARERADHTLQATALVNEAYLKLMGGAAPDVQDRAHFLGVAARAMRQLLVDHARSRKAAKRGGDVERVTLSAAQAGERSVALEELLDLDTALDRLDAIDPRLRQVVEYRYFAGLTDDEIADVLGVSRRTVVRDWARARAWLHDELYHDDDAGGPPARA